MDHNHHGHDMGGGGHDHAGHMMATSSTPSTIMDHGSHDDSSAGAHSNHMDHSSMGHGMMHVNKNKN